MPTYYIDYTTGNDSNPGTTKLSPWKRHPYMVGFAGTYSHSAGDRFIFRGGVAWPNACFRISVTRGGSSEEMRDYYGVDKTWYVGGAWARPIWDMEDTETAVYNQVIDIAGGLSYITLEGIEIRRFFWTGATSWPSDHMVQYNSARYVTFRDLYIHAWTHGSYVDGTRDDAMVFCGYTNPPFNPGVIIEGCTVDGSRSGDSMYATYGGSDIVRHNEVHDVVNGIASVGAVPENHLVHDNHVYHILDSFDPGMHENALVFVRGGRCFNNVVHDVAGSAMCIYVYPGEGNDMSDQYVYNNVVWDRAESANGCITIDVSSTTKYTGTVRVWNNTLVSAGTAACLRQQRQAMAGLVVQNNHFITSAADATTIEESIDTLTEDHNLKQTVAEATADGYDEVSEYAVVAGGSTIDAGVDTSATVTTDINTVVRPQGAAVDIGAYEYEAGGAGAYQVFYAANGALTGSVPTDASTYAENDPVTIAANSGSLAKQSYWAFTGWNTAADGSGTAYAPGATMTMPAADVTLYAQWRIKCALIAG